MPMSQLAASVRAELARFDPQQPIYAVEPMERLLAKTVAQRRFVLVLFELFAALALGLAALGLYGVLAHAVAERRREIGVRVALGATRASVLSLVAREGAILVGVGVGLGIAGGFAGSRLLTSLLYQVTPTDPLALVAAILLLAVASALAMWLPLRRALRVDPMEALRDE
jgi:ABC-type antimicrobial peptide transport system permease subunit